MRAKNALRNLGVSLIYEVFIFVIGLIMPRLIILSYGDAVNGLTQTITRLLTLINLIQAGAVGASIYQMYKPVADNDYETQSAIMYSSRCYFNKLGVIYLVVAMAAAVFYGFYLKSDELSPLEIILSFGILAVNGSLHFFFTARHDILFSSYQQRYLLTISTFLEKIVYYVLLFLVVLGELPFMFMYLALLCGDLVRVIVNTLYYRKLTKGKLVSQPKDKHYPIKDRKYLMLNSIGTEMITASPTIIITTLVGLSYSSVFSVYAMIYTSMKTIINSVQLAISAIFGNLVAKSENKKIAGVFNDLSFSFLTVGAFLASCAAFLFMPFINIYTSGFEGVSYHYPILAIFIVAYIAIFAFRTTFAFVATVYGLFKEICKITVVCGSICIFISALTTYLFGMPYVMVGVLLFHVSYSVIVLMILKKRVSWFTFKKLPLRTAMLIILPTISYVLSILNPIEITGFATWAMVAVGYAAVMAVVILGYSLIFERKELGDLLRYGKAVFFKKKKKKMA